MKKPGRIEWDDREGPAINSRRKLPGLVSAYFAQGRELLSTAPRPGDLHALRLATKRLRYTLELFRPCYGPGLAARLAGLRTLQQLLGEVNDCAVGASLLASVWRKSPQRGRVEQSLQQRRLTKTEAFRQEWKQVFDKPGQEREWTVYLARQSRSPGTAAKKR